MKKYFCDICGRELPGGETAFPSSCQKVAELCGLTDICADCLPLAAGLDIQTLLLDELRRRSSSLNDGADTGTPDPPIALKGSGEKEKRRILEGLKAYRTAHGLGSLRELSSRAKVPIENIQKMLLCENVPMPEWRKVAAALGIDKQ